MKNFQIGSKQIVVAAILLLTGLTFGFKQVETPKKITICHMPPGNTDNCQQISVGIEALEAHLNHGDNLICNDQNEEEAYVVILHEHLTAHPYSFTKLIRTY